MRPIPDYGDYMTIEKCASYIDDGFFTDYDGSGNYATATEMSEESFTPTTFIPKEKYTHVVWFNR